MECGQAELNGLLIGDGTPYRLIGFNPFRTAVRAPGEAPLSQADGFRSGREYGEAKSVPVRVFIDPDAGDPFELLTQLQAAFAPADIDVALRFHYEGRDLRLLGRPRLADADPDRLIRGRELVSGRFRAQPRIEADTESAVSMMLRSDSGGVTLPQTLPHTIDATFVTGRRTITNEGTKEATWRGIVEGPATDPRLVNFTTGQTLRIGVSIPAGRFLDLDSSTRAVLLDGTASRRGRVSGEWWQLQPGPNLIGWMSEPKDPAALFTIRYRHTWR